MPTSIGPAGVQKLNAVIASKKYELEAPSKRPTLLALGDYKAKLIEDVHKNSYETTQTYEFQFSDGETRKFNGGRAIGVRPMYNHRVQVTFGTPPIRLRFADTSVRATLLSGPQEVLPPHKVR